MGNTRNTGRHQGGADAVEGGVTHGPANAVHRRLPTRHADDHRPVRALRNCSQDRVQVLEYPDRFEVRYVSANGDIRWNCRWMDVSTVCIGEHVGLEEIDDGI